MRIAALLLVLMLVVAIATEVDGILRGRRRRRRRRRRPLPPIPTPAPCDSCSCCRSSGKRSVDLDGNIYPNDANLNEDYDSHYKGLPQWARDAVLKASEKRDLTYPDDCSSDILLMFAENCGFCVTTGGSDYKVCASDEQVTTIPPSLDNETCRNIINTLNARPECQNA